MTSPIRPGFVPTPAAQPRTDARAAQRAFFEQALGQARANIQPQGQPAAAVRTQPAVTPQPVQAAAPAQPAAPAAPAARAQAGAPERILRPGSLLDIRV